jgi:hypothetical protein
MATDESLLRERMSWDLIHALGMVAPEVSYTRLVINGKYIGLFLYIEWIDTDMLDRHGLGADGAFFHPLDRNFCGDLSLESVERPEHCWIKLSPRDSDFTELIGLVREIDETPVEEFHKFVERVFDYSSVVNWVVANTIVSNGDVYNKNYFLYRSRRTGKWIIIPWDYDLTFGRNWDPYLPYPKSVLNGNFQYYYPPELGAPSPFKDKLLKNPVLHEHIRHRLGQLLGSHSATADPAQEWFSPDRSGRRIDRLREEIEKHVRDDHFLADRYMAYEDHVEAVRHYTVARYNYLKKVVVGNPDWVRDYANARLDRAGMTVYFTDGWGFHLGSMTVATVRKSTLLAMEVKREPPVLLPPGHTAKQCVQRTWFLTLKTPGDGLKANLKFEYVEESSRNHDIGRSVGDEGKLKLWYLENDSWRSLPTMVNAYANTLTTGNINVTPTRSLRFVACAPGY